MSLPTPEEVRARWPEDTYPADTLGGARRGVLLKAHELIEALRERLGDDSEVGEVLISYFVADLLKQEARIDELQDQGLRTAFREVMGYDLPGEDR